MVGEDVVCLIKNSATLARQLYTLHVSQIRIDLPTLTDKDKQVICSFCVRNLGPVMCQFEKVILKDPIIK